jgi:hypothetical protein
LAVSSFNLIDIFFSLSLKTEEGREKSPAALKSRYQKWKKYFIVSTQLLPGYKDSSGDKGSLSYLELSNELSRIFK